MDNYLNNQINKLKVSNEAIENQCKEAMLKCKMEESQGRLLFKIILGLLHLNQSCKCQPSPFPTPGPTPSPRPAPIDVASNKTMLFHLKSPFNKRSNKNMNFTLCPSRYLPLRVAENYFCHLPPLNRHPSLLTGQKFPPPADDGQKTPNRHQSNPLSLLYPVFLRSNFNSSSFFTKSNPENPNPNLYVLF